MTGQSGHDDGGAVVGDRYELRGLLGRGGMAEVHRAYDRVLHREVAVKLMHAVPSLHDTVGRQRFLSETRLMARLNDPRLVALLDAGVDAPDDPARRVALHDPAAPPSGGTPWLVMELVEGPTLARRLEDGPLPPPEVAGIGAAVAAGLAHVHAHDVVHRDVKPANVLLPARAVGCAAKLADFGVARAAGEDPGLTATGHTIGTAAYLSPEQVRGAPVSGASDVYALGLVLLEALTGQRSYAGPPVESALARLDHGPLLPTSLGAGWVRLLDAMTATDPALRPSAEECARRLGALGTGGTGGTGGAAAPPAVTPTGAHTLVTPSVPGVGAQVVTRRRARATLATAVVLAASVALVAAVQLGGPDTTPPASARAAEATAPLDPAGATPSASIPSAGASRSALPDTTPVTTGGDGTDGTAGTAPTAGETKVAPGKAGKTTSGKTDKTKPGKAGKAKPGKGKGKGKAKGRGHR